MKHLFFRISPVRNLLSSIVFSELTNSPGQMALPTRSGLVKQDIANSIDLNNCGEDTNSSENCIMK